MPIPSDFPTSFHVTARERAFKQIQEWIIDGTLQPGEKLNDAEVAEALGISRTPIREALQLLEVQGFVEMFRGKATLVTKVDTADISKILPPLAALQSLAAELATPNVKSKDIQQLRKINTNFAQALNINESYSALKEDEQFHKIIIKAANNPYIESVISTLQAHVRRLFFHNSIILTHTSIEEHEKIINAFEHKDVDTSAYIMKNNWLRPIEEFYSYQKNKKQ